MTQPGYKATALWPGWGEIEGPEFDPPARLGGQKGPSIYLNNTTRGEIFDPQKPRWGGGLKNEKGTGNIF